MSFDFFKNFMNLGDEERFAKICENIEEAIREVETEMGEEKISDLELMQALDFVGFNLFRDNWEEYKKMDLNRDMSSLAQPDKDRHLIH